MYKLSYIYHAVPLGAIQSTVARKDGRVTAYGMQALLRALCAYGVAIRARLGQYKHS